MSSILDIKKRLEEHRKQLEEQREEETGLKRRRGGGEGEEAPQEMRYERRPEAGRDLGMDELLREIKNREQKHLEELKGELANIDDLKEILNQMIKESEEHISELEGKLEKYER